MQVASRQWFAAAPPFDLQTQVATTAAITQKSRCAALRFEKIETDIAVENKHGRVKQVARLVA